MALIDQWIAANGPLPALTFGDASDVAANQQAQISSRFRARVITAAIAAAIAIANELATTPDHVNRAALAKSVLQNARPWIEPYSSALSSLGLSDASTDTDIQSGISSVWNAISG